MFKTMVFNIYAENLEELVFKNREPQSPVHINAKESLSQIEFKPIPKPAAAFWKNASSYHRENRQSDKTNRRK